MFASVLMSGQNKHYKLALSISPTIICMCIKYMFINRWLVHLIPMGWLIFSLSLSSLSKVCSLKFHQRSHQTCRRNMSLGIKHQAYLRSFHLLQDQTSGLHLLEHAPQMDFNYSLDRRRMFSLLC